MLMQKIYKSAEELIGNTPLLEARNIEKKFNLESRLLLKLEYFNPTGSVKDRAARAMLDDAERRGVIGKNAVIIEATSGNTGIGLASVGTSRGYRVIIVMPDNMSRERITLMSAYGAELVLTDGKDGMPGAIRRAEELAREIPNSFIAGQFDNPANARAHYETTGPEIYNDTDGEVDIFVAGVGTGGTLTGTAEYLKERKPELKVIAVEPDRSAVLSGDIKGAHGIQGIGAGFIPSILNTDIYDEIARVTEDEAYATARLLGKTEGLLVGISSGAALFAAIEVAKRKENKGKTVVVLLADTGDRYLSTPMFND
jgi:cysteine synthase A